MILSKVEESNESLILLGDFNGHIDMLGYQKQDENGRVVVELINDFGLSLLNLDEACQGMYTWGRLEQKSAIDFVLVNKKAYENFQSLHIDESREILDISDHCTLTSRFRIPTEKVNFKRGKTICKTYYKTDEESLEQFSDEMQRRLREKAVEKFEELNELMK